MIPKTVVEHDTSGLEMVLNALDELTEERFVEGVIARRYDEDDVKKMTEMVKIYQGRVNIESIALTRFSNRFIRQFATNNNNCFKTSELLFKKIRSTLAGLKKVFHKTTPIDRRTLPEGTEVPSVFDKSSLVNKEFTPDLYGLDSYPSYVYDFYKSIETLFASSASMLALCQMMIVQEEETRKDVVLLRQIYQESCDELTSTVKMASKFQLSNQELPENELDELKRRTGSDEEKFLKLAYHSYNKEVLTQYLIIKMIRQARNQGLTDLEAFFWHKNTNKGLLVRKVIENFDLVIDVEGNGGKLSPRAIVEFLKWCGVNEALEKQLYKNHFLPHYLAKGKLKPIAWTTISGLRKDIKDDKISDSKLARIFAARLTNILTPEELAA